MPSSTSNISPPETATMFADSITRSWYAPRGWTLLLLPLAGLFRVAAALRRWWLRGRDGGRRLAAPVIVVGNIAVGGTGKTPLIIALAESLRSTGLRPGVISRGYGGRAGAQPCVVTADSSADAVGDEPLLIATVTGCPVVVGADRRRAAVHLLAGSPVDLILSDDGLQHYGLHRDLEIVVIDADRGLGNGHCLPAGPLREPAARLASVDIVVVNGVGFVPPRSFSTMRIVPLHFRHLASGELIKPEDWPHGPAIHAVAGIGNPARFATTLAELGLIPRLHAFPDHHRFSAADLDFGDTLPVVMTAKDAVKCTAYAGPRLWVLDVAAQLPEEMLTLLLDRIRPLLSTASACP